MAKKKEIASNPDAEEVLATAVAEEETTEPSLEGTVVQDVEAVSVADGQRIPAGKREKAGKSAEPENEEAQPALSAASRKSSHERKRDAEEHQAARKMRQEDAMTVGKYLSAQKRNNVLSGMISGVEVRDNHALWIIYDGPVIVMIPFKEALPFLDDVLADTSETRVRQTQLLSKSVGATIQFSVEGFEPDPENDTYLVYGSRRNALQRISKRYFGTHAANPLKVGDDTVGTFLAVGPHAAWLTVNGVDVRMTPRQLSHRFMEDMTKVYAPGDEITLRVQAIEMQDGKPALRLSALPTELEECKTRHDRIRRGNRYVATITSHRVVNVVDPETRQKRAQYVASMWLEGVEVAAFATVTSSHAKGTAHSGDRVLVEVEQLSRNGYVRCRIISYLSN